MPGRCLTSCVVVVLSAFFASPASAEAVFFFEGPFQSSPAQALDPVPILEGERYQRETYEAVGVLFNLFVDNDNFYPEDSDSWFLSIDQVEPYERLGEIAFSYDAEQDCLVYQGGPIQCEIRAGAESEDVAFVRYRVWVWFNGQCAPTEDYALAMDFQPSDGARQEVEGSPFVFRPTRFIPTFERLVVSNEIEPQVQIPRGVSYSPGYRETIVTAIITDNLDCLQPIEEARVRFANTIVPDDPDQPHGHDHFHDDDAGTGVYQGMEGLDWELPDDGLENTATIIEGYTNRNGFFSARYASGELGLTELITASVSREETDNEPKVVGEDATARLKIRIPDLIQYDLAALSVIRADGGGCPHSPPADWLSPDTMARLSKVTNEYAARFGRRLSLNDGSLPFGGLIDNKKKNPGDAQGGGRDAACHLSHRLGVDVDLNRRDSGGAMLRCFRRELASDPPECEVAVVQNEEGTEVDLLDMVTELFELENAFRITSPGIHYRFFSTQGDM